MNKHQSIRSITILLIIALVSALSNLNTSLIIFQPLENDIVNQYNWQEDIPAEMELTQLQMQCDVKAYSEMETKLLPDSYCLSIKGIKN